MNIAHLVAQLRQRGLSFEVDDGELLISGDDALLDDATLDTLRPNKAAIIAHLRERAEDAARGEFPVSPAQRRMLFMEELAGNASYYNIPVAFELEGALDKHALRESIRHLLAAHDVLRSSYVARGDDFVQQVHALDELPFFEQDLTGQEQGALAAVLEREADHQFDLARDLPIRVLLIDLGGGRHVLSVNVHHIAADGWSAATIFRAISSAYNDIVARPGQPAGTPVRGPQYADYVSWLEGWSAGDGQRLALDYWKERLADLPHLHGVPTDFVRAPLQSVEGATYSEPLPQALREQATGFASRHATTLFAVMQTAFAALLARYSGDEDIVFGTAVGNRHPLEFLDTVGLFVNTVVLRHRVDGGAGFGALLQQATDVRNGAFRHQQLPFDALVEALQPPRSLGYNPLVQIMLVMQDKGANVLELRGLKSTQLPQRQAVSKFDLALHIESTDEGMALVWEYKTGLFTRDTIARMSGHFLRLLAAGMAAPEQPLGEVALVAPADLACVRDGAPAQPGACIHRLFEAQVCANPYAVALRDDDGTVSYRELDEAADRVAVQLARLPGVRGGRVGVCMDKTAALVVAMLAIFKSGATYVPLDPNYPAERLKFMVADSGIRVLLTSAARPLDAGLVDTIDCLDIDTLAATPQAATAPAFDDPGAPAYVIYTSGSTGKPKGVVVSHAALSHSLRENGRVFGMAPGDAMPTIGSQAFGVSLLEILVPLTHGATVRMVARTKGTDLEQLVRATNDVTVLHAVPSLMRLWLDLQNSGAMPEAYPRLRMLLVGGEPVPDELLRKLNGWRAGVQVRELYGMTESAVVSSSYAWDGVPRGQYCVGKPLPHARFYVLNRQRQIQPVGVAGELYIGGQSVAEGYLNQPAMTAEKFIDDPFGAQSGNPGRLYQTGDRVRLLADGQHEFLGRVDNQLSLRGARIELGEIEAVAGGVAEVRQAVAHVVELADDDRILVLYYTTDSGSADPGVADALQAAFAAQLPDYARPSRLQWLSTFPLNANGKVDRKLLPRPQATTTANALDGQARTDTERTLRALCQEILQQDEISMTAGFFELGGHSLMATRLATRVRATFGIAFPLSQLFSASNLRDCARLIDAELQARYAAALIRPAAAVDEADQVEISI